MKFNRIFLIVLDSLGVGEAIDAKKFNDEGANTLGHILENNPIDYPNLEKMGFLNLVNFFMFVNVFIYFQLPYKALKILLK